MATPAEPNLEAGQRPTGPVVVAPTDVDVRSIGRTLPRVEAPEGWVKRVERVREGKVWVGYFHVWETTPAGQRVRRKKEKTLGPATKPRHEALKDLSDYIAQYTGKPAKQGESISTFAELWKAYCAVKSGQWSKKTRENLECLFARHVLSRLGRQEMRSLTLTSLQLLVNRVAEDGIQQIGRRADPHICKVVLRVRGRRGTHSEESRAQARDAQDPKETVRKVPDC